MKTNGDCREHQHLQHCDFSPQVTVTSNVDSLWCKTKPQPIPLWECSMNDILGIHNGWKKRWEWKVVESAGFWNNGGDCVTGSSCSIAACVPFYPLTLTKRHWRDCLKRNPWERFYRRSHPTSAISRSPAQKVKGSEGGLVWKPFIHHFDLVLSWWYEVPPN